jgi:hypothetical protein
MSSVQTIVAAIQQVMAAARAGAATRAGRAPPRAPAGNPLPDRPNRREGMEAMVRRRVGGIDPDDPGRGRKAFRVFLESVLLQEFGEQLINDPAFYLMLDAVQAQMEADPHLSGAIEQAIALLLRAPGDS